MIYKNAQFGSTKNVTVCEFGEGDVLMIPSHKGENGETILVLRNAKSPRKIGEKRRINADSFDELQPELVFVFNKIESIDALINSLQDCRDEMIKE